MELKKNGWYHYDSKAKKEVYVAPPIDVTERYKDLESNEILITIEDDQGAKYHGTMEVLGSRNIEDLLKYGFPITPANKNLLCGALVERVNKLPFKIIYTNVGLTKHNNNYQFQGHTLLSSEGLEGVLKSDSPYDLQPSGNIDTWLQMYTDHVTGNTRLELILALGVSGIVITYLKKVCGVDLHNPIVHLYGDSSTGKTTAAQLALSVGGNPKKERGLFKTWNSTANGLVSMLSGNYGIPLLFDEISTISIRSLTTLIYTLAEGLERGRSNINGQHKEQREWSTVMLSTGEVGIDELGAAKQNTGIGVRLLQFEEVFTQSSNQSESIKRVINKNYGHVLPLIAKKVIESNEEDISHFYNERQHKFHEALKGQHKVVERVANLYAAVTLAAFIFNETFGEYNISMDEAKIFDFLVAHEKKVSTTRDLGEQAYEKLIQYLVTNQNKIADAKSIYSNSTGTIGFYDETRKDIYAIKILKGAFEDFINHHSDLQGSKKVAKALKEKNYFIVPLGRDRIGQQETVKPGHRETFYTLHLKPGDHTLFNPLNDPEKKDSDPVEQSPKAKESGPIGQSPEAKRIFKGLVSTSNSTEDSDIDDEDIGI